MFNMKKELISEFKTYLVNEEKSKATVEKYVRDTEVFSKWLSGRELCKEEVLFYKEKLMDEYAPRSVNSVISSLNAFFDFISRHDCKVKTLKIQRQIVYLLGCRRQACLPEQKLLTESGVIHKPITLFYLHMSLSCTATYASKITFCDVTEQTPYYTV